MKKEVIILVRLRKGMLSKTKMSWCEVLMLDMHTAAAVSNETDEHLFFQYGFLLNRVGSNGSQVFQGVLMDLLNELSQRLNFRSAATVCH